jgi:hypothetical protein
MRQSRNRASLADGGPISERKVKQCGPEWAGMGSPKPRPPWRVRKRGNDGSPRILYASLAPLTSANSSVGSMVCTVREPSAAFQQFSYLCVLDDIIYAEVAMAMPDVTR